MKFLGHITKKEGYEYGIPSILKERDRVKQHITYPVSLCKRMTELGLGKITINMKFIKRYKGTQIVESRDYQVLDQTQYIEEY